jgi:hypothetical protein
LEKTPTSKKSTTSRKAIKEVPFRVFRGKKEAYKRKSPLGYLGAKKKHTKGSPLQGI